LKFRPRDKDQEVEEGKRQDEDLSKGKKEGILASLLQGK